MAQTRRVQLLMEPDEYARLEQIAQAQETSVAELIRTTVRERYLNSVADKHAVVSRIASLNLPVDDWEVLRDEIR